MDKLLEYKKYLLNIKKSLVYYNYLSPLFKHLESNKLDFFTLTKDYIADYFKQKEYKPNAINSLINAMRDFCRYTNTIEHDCFKIKLLEVDVKFHQYITYEELLDGIKKYSTYSVRGMDVLKANAVLKFMFFTGVRKGELFSLTRDKIDLTNCSAIIWGSKDKEERIVYFSDDIVKDLVIYFNSEPENKNAFSISNAELNYLVKKIGKYIQKNISPHILRHSSAVYMTKKNINPLIIQRILGHSSLQTTLRYANPDDKTAQEIYKKQIG